MVGRSARSLSSNELLGLTPLFCDDTELLQRRLEILHDLGCDDFWIWQVVRVFQALVLQPEDVQAHLVALDQLVIREGLEPIGLLPASTVERVVETDGLFQRTVVEPILFQGEVLVHA